MQVSVLTVSVVVVVVAKINFSLLFLVPGVKNKYHPRHVQQVSVQKW